MRSGDALLDHLYRRAGFGASAADLQAVAGMSYQAAVDYFLNFATCLRQNLACLPRDEGS